MKKIMFGIAGVIAMVASANATDTSRIKAACQASDKTLWVERNQVCIPKNPCKDSKFEAYCNRNYKNLELWGNESAMLLVEAYAKGHNLACIPIETKSKLFGQDYMICMGDDVMVFEFDDLSDTPAAFNQKKLDEYTETYARFLCEAMGGAYSSGFCHNVSENQCELLAQMDENYGVLHLYISWSWPADKNEPMCYIGYNQNSFFNGGVF